MTLLIVLLVFILLIFLATVTARWNYGTLEKIVGPEKVVPPYWIGGSDPFFYKKIYWKQDLEDRKKYGMIYGYYEGSTPILMISDKELIRLILTQNFDHFNGRRVLDLGHDLFTEIMDSLPYAKWNIVRKRISPQFTNAKIGQMYGPTKQALEKWINRINNNQSQTEKRNGFRFIAKKEFYTLTTDIITRSLFGIVLADMKEGDEFLQSIQLLTFSGNDASGWYSFFQTYPFLTRLLPVVSKKSLDYLEEFFRNLLKSRKITAPNGQYFIDLLAQMLDSCDNDEGYKKLDIKHLTILTQAFNALVAGLETTANTMALMVYHLVKNPQIQDKVLQEVDNYFEKYRDNVNPENISELCYLTAFMQETLRLNPLFLRIERRCEKDFYHDRTGLRIPKGTTIQIPVLPVHFDPDNYEDPMEFNPERFLLQNKDAFNPYVYLPFGEGPHHCLGKRFVHKMVPFVMASLLKIFKFEDCSDTDLVSRKGQMFMNDFVPFPVILKLR